MYKVGFTKKAYKEFLDLPKKTRGRFEKIIDNLSENPFDNSFDIKKLNSPLTGYRLRVGNFRFLFSVAEEIKILQIYKVSHRKDAYK